MHLAALSKCLARAAGPGCGRLEGEEEEGRCLSNSYADGSDGSETVPLISRWEA